MAARKLGGGRVLGNGRALSPAVPTLRPSSTLLSPSPSSVSLTSQVSTLLSTENQDLSSRVSLENADRGQAAAAATAAANTKLVCPICNEEMVTLLQLNRHLDDDHKNLEEVEQDEVKNWFRTRMIKAKRFQPLAVLNQKLKGLDVFETNDAPPPVVAASSGSSTPDPVHQDADELVTRSHWQRPGPSDACSEPMCGKNLGLVNGTINCRKCGKLFCEEHTMYQMKLSRSAQHEPVRGFWCRVCETCYKSREGYNDHSGLERNHTKIFAEARKRTVNKSYLEVSRLEKRLTKLTQLLANAPEDTSKTGGILWPLSGQNDQRKKLEQSVVTWEDDASVSKCPFCQQEFSNYTFRRHHCRTCGRVVCGDPRTKCSVDVGLNANSEKSIKPVGVDIRMCRDCKHTIFSKRDFAEELANTPPDARAYQTLTQFERGIRLMLPKFQRLLVSLQDPVKPPTPIQLSEASKVRKRLMEAFTQYDIAARRLRDLPTKSATQQKLQKSVHQQANNFLHLHMLPLKTLPKILKHAAPQNANGQRALGSRSNGSLSAIRYNDIETASQVSSSSAVSALESEEKELRERLIVLEEQKFLLSEMIADANKRRKFDEVKALAQNVQELSLEIDRVDGMLGQLDFATAYAQGGPISPRHQ